MSYEDVVRVKNVIATRSASAGVFMNNADALALAKDKLVHEGKLASSELTWSDVYRCKSCYVKLGVTGNNHVLEFCSTDINAPTAKPWTASALEATAKPMIAAGTCCANVVGTAVAGSGTRVGNAAMALVALPAK